MVYCVGLTGNIASGKTTAAEIFSGLGVDVFSADKISRELTTSDPAILKKIVSHFGPEVMLEDGQLNRKRLREIIFSNPDERNWLEQLLHPLIRQELKKKVAESMTPYCVVEIPLLIDKTTYPYLNTIVVINSSLEIQIERVMARDHCTKEHALAIILAQPDFSIRLQHADHVLMNDSGYTELKRAVENLHHLFMTEAKAQSKK